MYFYSIEGENHIRAIIHAIEIILTSQLYFQNEFGNDKNLLGHYAGTKYDFLNKFLYIIFQNAQKKLKNANYIRLIFRIFKYVYFLFKYVKEEDVANEEYDTGRIRTRHAIKEEKEKREKKEKEKKEKEKKEKEVFFKECYRFLTEKYGSRNVITADVHYDESTPHLHFTFVPTVANNRKYKDPNKKPRYTEKVCADELITREHLKAFHSELQKWFIDKGMDWAKSVSTGTTTYNKSIAELKQRTEDYCNEMVVKAKQAKEQAESDAQKLVNKQIDILHSMETYEPHTITAHQLPLGMVAVKKKDFLEVYKHASASVGLRNTWKRIQETEQGQQVEKLQKELEEERAKNAENARLEQEKQKRYSEVLEKAENTLKMQKNTIEMLKKENEELREKFELVKKVVLDMWDHVSEYFKSQLERIGIRKSRSYHR